GGAAPGAGAAGGDRPGRSPRPGDDRPEVPGEGAGQSVHDGGGTGGGPAGVPRRPADRCSPGGQPGAGGEGGAAEPRWGRGSRRRGAVAGGGGGRGEPGANEVRAQREDDRIAAEKQRADDRIAAEKQRLADLRTADEVARRKQREVRAQALVQALMTADHGDVLRLIGEMAEYRDLVLPALRERADERLRTRSGFRARLALLGLAPGGPTASDLVLAA